jgi:hypothetical protein
METELLQRELNTIGLRDRDQKGKILLLERELSEIRDVLRSCGQELDVRTKENDHLVSLLEDQEQKISLYEEKEKQVYALANDSKKRIEEINLERDRVLLKEQQYLTRISRLEEQLKLESNERQERHDRVVESLRQKHRTMLEQKHDEISNISRQLSDATEKAERCRMDRDSGREELAKLKE